MPTVADAAKVASKVKEERFGITFGGKLLGGVVWKTTKRGETIIKTLSPASAHLSLFSADKKLVRHVTHERYPQGSKRRHTQRASIRPEGLVTNTLAALAPADDPPPTIHSFQDPAELDRLTEWFTRVFPKIFRKAEDRPIVLLKGPAQDLIEQGIFWSLPERATFELEPMIAFYRDAEIETEDDAYIHAKETDLRPSGPRIGFTFGMRKMIVCLAEGTVLELDYDRLEEAAMKNFELLGFKGLIR